MRILLQVLYALMGAQAGYVSARLYKLLKGTQWKRNTIQTALLVPGVCLSIFFCLNIVLGLEDSSATVGFLRLFTIAFLWVGVSVPLVFAGAYYGYRKDAIEPPCKVNQIPRQVPPQLWYTGPVASVLMGGKRACAHVCYDCVRVCEVLRLSYCRCVAFWRHLH